MRSGAFVRALGLVIGFAAISASGMIFEETWDDGDLGNWGSETARARMIAADGALNIQFRKQSQPFPESDVAKLTFSADMVITNVSFRFKSEITNPGTLRLQFQARSSHRRWYVSLPSGALGEWTEYSIPLTYGVGWMTGPNSTKEQFLQDIADIEWIGVYVARHGNVTGQQYAMDDFTLNGVASSCGVPQQTDGDLDGMRNDWEEAHGLNPDDSRDAMMDQDGDRMSNFEEYIAGTDPSDSGCAFRVEIQRAGNASSVKGASEGFSIRWSSADDRVYTVFRSYDLSEGFECIADNVAATPPMNEYTDGSEDGRVAFYKVAVRLAE